MVYLKKTLGRQSIILKLNIDFIDNKTKFIYVLTVFLFVLGSHLSLAQKEIPLENYFRTLKSVKVKIEDKEYKFLFDTGGGLTIISPSIAKELKKDIYGNYVGYRMSGEKIQWKLCDSLNINIGGIDFFHSNVGVFDLMGLLPNEFEHIDGLISLQTFENKIITLKMDKSILVLESDKSYKEKIKNMSLVQSRFANGQNGNSLTIFLETKINNNPRSWWFLLDSGNIAQTKISKHIADEMGMISAENSIMKFEVSSNPTATTTIIDDIIYDGAFSFDNMKPFEFTISFIDNKVWITPFQN